MVTSPDPPAWAEVLASMIWERLVADTMPVATDCSRPKGAPRVITHWPTVRSSELPISMGVRPLASLAFSTATSEDGSAPTSSAS